MDANVLTLWTSLYAKSSLPSVQSVYESIVTIDYVDAVSNATGKDRLVSDDPYFAAQSRIWCEKVNRECCSPYYGVLVRKDDTERKEHFNSLVKGLQVCMLGELGTLSDSCSFV